MGVFIHINKKSIGNRGIAEGASVELPGVAESKG